MGPIWMPVKNRLTMGWLHPDLIGVRTHYLRRVLLLRVDDMAWHVLHILVLVVPLHPLFLLLKFF